MAELKRTIIDLIFNTDSGVLLSGLTIIASLYVPIAILIYQEISEDKSPNKFEWEKTVLLKKIIRGWQILGAIVLSSITTMFWNYPNIWVKLSSLIVFLIGIIILIANLIRLFKWLISDKIGMSHKESYRQKQKIKFLRKLDPNSSLEVWDNIFSSVQPENAYLIDYLKIFFDKFSKAKEIYHWQYKLCFSKNMKNLYFQNPDFQESVIDFAFDAYITENGSGESKAYIHKRAIVKELVKLLIKSGDRYCFAISRAFNKKLSNAKYDDNLLLNGVRKFSSDILQEILNAYDNIPWKESPYDLDIFPVDKWNVLALTSSKDKIANAKAMGLFITYLDMIPTFINRNGEIDGRKADFLDNIVFGVNSQRISKKLIRVVTLYFSQNFFILQHERENTDHAKIRSFIDKNYGSTFMNTVCYVSSTFTPHMTEKQRVDRLTKLFDIERTQQDERTLKLITSAYPALLDTKNIEKIQKDISNYNLKDKKYKYATNTEIVKNNLMDLQTTMNKIAEYGNTKKNQD